MLTTKGRRHPLEYRYVNGMLNITYFTGFVRKPEKNGTRFLIQQNNNLQQAVPILTSKGTLIPKEFTPVTVLTHVYGNRNGDGVAEAEFRCIDIRRPSTRSMPALLAWNSGLPANGLIASPDTPGVFVKDDFRPFGADGKLKPTGADQDEAEGGEEAFSEQEGVLRDILEATRGRMDTHLGDNANVVLLAGFIEGMAYVQPNPHQRDGYGVILLRQHEDPSKSIPVRLYNGQAMRIMQSTTIGSPVSIAGQARMKIIPTEDGMGVASMNLHVRTSEIYSPDRERDFRQVPDWWASMRDRLVQERQSRAQTAQAASPAVQPQAA